MMQTALYFLKAHTEIALATCEGNLPVSRKRLTLHFQTR